MDTNINLENYNHIIISESQSTYIQ